MDDWIKVMRTSTAGMKAQGTRMRVIAENLANADSLPTEPGKDPYRRRVVTFRGELDKSTGLQTVRVNRVQPDRSNFPQRYDPGHPSADANGYVKTPNVNSLIETMDMREAQRSYDANLNALRTSKAMVLDTIGVLRR